MRTLLLLAVTTTVFTTACGSSSDVNPTTPGIIGGCVSPANTQLGADYQSCDLYEGPSSQAPAFQKFCTDAGNTWNSAGCPGAGKLGCCRNDAEPAQYTTSTCYYGSSYAMELGTLRAQCLSDGNHWL